MFAKKGYDINGQPTPPSSPVSTILVLEWIVLNSWPLNHYIIFYYNI